MKLKYKLLPIVALSGIATTIIPLASCSKGGQQDPEIVHNIMAENLISETASLFKIECSQQTYSDADVDGGLKLTFTLTKIGSEPFDSYVFIHYGNISIETNDGEHLDLKNGFTWERDETKDFVWNLTFKKEADIVSKLKSATKMTVGFKVQNRNDISIQLVDDAEEPIEGFTADPTVINFDTFDRTILIANDSASFSISAISVSLGTGWMVLQNPRDYTTQSVPPTSRRITLTDNGMLELGYLWYQQPVETLRIKIKTV